ncbi:zinc finger protein 518A [Pleurodeles waltl]|uniref:zinc finger protein 518A n=1 Tax=Pleurodeles waltl TaxID=8319 RepID=UPI0037093E8E
MKTEKDQYSLVFENQVKYIEDHAGRYLNEADNDVKKTTIKKTPISEKHQTTFSNDKPSNEVKRLQVDLPKMNLSDKVTFKDGNGDIRLFQRKRQTARKSLIKGKLEESQLNESSDIDLQPKQDVGSDEDRNKTLSKICNFPCPKCKGRIRYSPNDLQKHYSLLHHGELPNYPCEMCSFSSNDFQKFTQHRQTHRSTLVKCDICNDEQFYSLLDLTKHFTSQHSINGEFSCEQCIFCTSDVGTFVQHIHRHCDVQYKCEKCNHVSFNKIEFQEHLEGHISGFSFTCRYCNFSSTRKDNIVNHIIAAHKEKLLSKDTPENVECESKLGEHKSPLKLVLTRHATETSKAALWKQKTNQAVSGETMITNKQILIQCKSENTSQPSYQGNVNDETDTAAKQGKVILTAQGGATLCKQDNHPSTSAGLLTNAVKGPTVLMVKNNKISVPANYCAKFMGFKVVDGKQHIALKLLPTTNQSDWSSEFESLALKSGSIACLKKSTNRNVICESSSTSEHAANHSTQQSNEYRPVSSPTTEEKPDLSGGRNLNSSTSLAAMSKAKSMFQMPVRSASLPDLSDITMISGEEQSPFLSRSSNSDIPQSTYRVTSKQKVELLCDQSLFQKSHQLTGPAPSMLNVRKGRSSDASNMANGDVKAPESCKLFESKSSVSESLQKNGNLCKQGPQMSSKLLPPAHSNYERVLSLPKFTSVYSVQNPPACSFIPVKVGQVVQNPVKKSNAYQTLPPAADNQLLLTSVQQSSSSYFTRSVVTGNLHMNKSSGPGVEADVALKSSATYSGKTFEMEKIPKSLHGSQDGKSTKASSISSVLKTHSNAIINQQLAKEKLSVTSHNLNGSHSLKILRPQTQPEKSSFLLASSPSGIILPVHLGNQAGLQIMPGSTVSSSNVSGVQLSSVPSSSGQLSKRPGMILTFSGGAFGAVANITTGSSQVLSSVAQNNQVEQKLPNTNHSLASNFNQASVSVANQVSQVPLQGPFIVANSINSPLQVARVPSQVNGLPAGLNVLQYCTTQAHAGATFAHLEPGKLRSETQNKQPIYALLPDGRRAVLLKYAPPTGKPHKSLQSNAANHIFLPKNPEGPKQKYVLKIVQTSQFQVPVACKSQSTINTSVASLKVDGVQSPEGTTFASLKRSLSSSASTATSPEESLLPTKHLKTLLQKGPTNLTQELDSRKPSGSIQQQAMWNRNKSNVSKRKYDLDNRQSGSEASKRNRCLRRKPKAQTEMPPKKKTLARKCKEKNRNGMTDECVYTFEPRASKECRQTLRLLPFSLNQNVKCPRRNQPVVVLNHPDADFPEIVNVMKTITKFKGHVVKVSLSRRTIEALLHTPCGSTSKPTTSELTAKSHKVFMPVSPVKERFVLKLTLKKTSKNKYKIVRSSSKTVIKSTFTCWFCGRIFENQDEWVGHGQRHLMEATRDWNILTQ